MPGIAATALICFIFSWNELLFARVLTATVAQTAPVFLTGFVTSQGLFLAKVCAASPRGVAACADRRLRGAGQAGAGSFAWAPSSDSCVDASKRPQRHRRPHHRRAPRPGAPGRRGAGAHRLGRRVRFRHPLLRARPDRPVRRGPPAGAGARGRRRGGRPRSGRRPRSSRGSESPSNPACRAAPASSAWRAGTTSAPTSASSPHRRTTARSASTSSCRSFRPSRAGQHQRRRRGSDRTPLGGRLGLSARAGGAGCTRADHRGRADRSGLRAGGSRLRSHRGRGQ